MTTIEGSEIEENISLKIIMDKLNAMESKIKDNFTQVHSQMGELRCEFKQQIDGVKESIKEIEKSLENSWAAIEDVQQESKAYKDSKRSHQEMLDKQTNLIPQQLQSEVRNVRDENDKLRPSLKETQEKLITLENYTRKENLTFMNIPERPGKNCWDIVYDIIENELKISTQDIRLHAVHRVGKPAAQNDDNSTSTRPRPVIARFVSREHTKQVLGVKNRLKKSDRYKDAYITKDYARAIQEERRSLIKAMFAAREKGRDAKVINRKPLY